LNKSLKERFDADKISIPYPQRALHFVGSTPAPPISAASD